MHYVDGVGLKEGKGDTEETSQKEGPE